MARLVIAILGLVAFSAAAALAADSIKPLPTEPTVVPKQSGDLRVAAVKVTPTLLAAGDPVLRSTHGDWQVRCDKLTGAIPDGLP